MLAPELYEIYRVEATSADVSEGSVFPTRIWERAHYEWSADRVRWTVQESNYCTPGSHVEVTVRPEPGGGSQLHVEWNREGVGIKGKILIALVGGIMGADLKSDRRLYRPDWKHGLKHVQAAPGCRFGKAARHDPQPRRLLRSSWSV
jgi:hypothetical protein